jgi:glycosyltransferase involved in cell wall biosynthesis
MKTISLCMIVKNESHVIERCLNSVKSLIDYVFIVDTGSTDNTIEVINNWLTTNSIIGQVISEEWKNFSHNRSFALSELRKLD